MKPILFILLLLAGPGFATDHNEPNSLNSIFADVKPDASDLYGVFGFPVVEDGKESLVVLMTFSPSPAVNQFDDQVLHRIHLDADRRPDLSGFKPHLDPIRNAAELARLLKFLKRQAEAHLQPKNHPEIQVTYGYDEKDSNRWKAKVRFLNFQGKTPNFYVVPETNTIGSFLVNGQRLRYFIGGADDPFFTDLGGFFRSINYAPFLKAPFNSFEDPKEINEPKKLLTTNWAGLFNNPPELIYTGEDSRAKYNVNAIALQIPVALIAKDASTQRIIRVWGDGNRVKASRRYAFGPREGGHVFRTGNPADYVRMDTLGIPFVDTVLGEREERFNTGANNLLLQDDYVRRFAHLGWGFGPSLVAMGLDTCFSFHPPLPKPFSLLGNANRPVNLRYDYTVAAASRVAGCLLQSVKMPPGLKWQRTGVNVSPPMVASLFHPNTLMVDLDTTGTWPFGRRPEDQVASRFTALFLDMNGKCGGKPCDLDSLQDGTILPGGKGINPVTNDKPFRPGFPYLAEPWPVNEAK